MGLFYDINLYKHSLLNSIIKTLGINEELGEFLRFKYKGNEGLAITEQGASITLPGCEKLTLIVAKNTPYDGNDYYDVTILDTKVEDRPSFIALLKNLDSVGGQVVDGRSLKDVFAKLE